MRQIRLFGMSAFFSVMIWFLADQSLSSTANFQVQLIPVPAAGSDIRVSMYGDPPIEQFELQIAGKATILEQLLNEQPIVLRVPVAERPSGVYLGLDVAEHVRNAATRLSSMVIENASPKYFAVQVDREVKEELPIRIMPGAMEYEVRPTVVPSKVIAIMSEIDFKSIPVEERFIAFTPDEYIRTARRGVLNKQNIPLPQLVGDYQATFQPESVSLQYQLKELFDEQSFTAVPIKIEASFDIFNSYVIETRDGSEILTRPITIRGPAESVERIRSGEHRLVGVISLSAEYLSNPTNYRYSKPRFNLPGDVKVVNDPAPLEIRLVPRSDDNRGTE